MYNMPNVWLRSKRAKCKDPFQKWNNLFACEKYDQDKTSHIHSFYMDGWNQQNILLAFQTLADKNS